MDKAPKKPKPPAAPAAKPRWAASKIEKWAIERIKPYDRNARTHPERQIKQLRSSLLRFGFTIPLLVRADGTLIAGHGRLEAAKAENYATVPVIVAAGWSEEDCRAYTLLDNKLAEGSKWDTGLRALEIADLAALGCDLSTFGLKPVDPSSLVTTERSSAA
jgi:ParB-like chromosome segregation protein Spo0J